MKRNFWWLNSLKQFCGYCTTEQTSKYIDVWGAWNSHGRRVAKKWGKGEGELCCIGLDLEVSVQTQTKSLKVIILK